MEIIWAKSAVNGLLKIYEHIYESSPQNANQILDEIAEKVTVLTENPERHNPDKYKRNNTGAYRAFEYKKIRVSYKIDLKKIKVVRIKHSKQKLKEY